MSTLFQIASGLKSKFSSQEAQLLLSGSLTVCSNKHSGQKRKKPDSGFPCDSGLQGETVLLSGHAGFGSQNWEQTGKNFDAKTQVDHLQLGGVLSTLIPGHQGAKQPSGSTVPQSLACVLHKEMPGTLEALQTGSEAIVKSQGSQCQDGDSCSTLAVSVQSSDDTFTFQEIKSGVESATPPENAVLAVPPKHDALLVRAPISVSPLQIQMQMVPACQLRAARFGPAESIPPQSANETAKLPQTVAESRQLLMACMLSHNLLHPIVQETIDTTELALEATSQVAEIAEIARRQQQWNTLCGL